MRGPLKRKFAEVEDACWPSSSPSSSPSHHASSEGDSDGESHLAPGGDPISPAAVAEPARPILKKRKLARAQSNVHFDMVTVYHFPRCQGFISVPSHGGATLGMGWKHCSLRRYTLAEHAAERRRRHGERLRERQRQERLQAWRHKLVASGTMDWEEADRLSVDQVPDGFSGVRSSNTEPEEGRFLQPYSYKQRKALLRAAGVKRIDREEKRHLHALRRSRQDCGCRCEGFCEPETCACSLDGITCQMDRSNFPCGCTKEGCGNSQGRVEFNSVRVQTHYIHTIMRVQLERRLPADPGNQLNQREAPRRCGEEDEGCAPSANTCPFGFSMEEEGLLFSMSSSSSSSSSTIHLISEHSLVEGNSCSRATADSSSSSSSSPSSSPSSSASSSSSTIHLISEHSLVEGNSCSRATADSSSSSSSSSSTSSTCAHSEDSDTELGSPGTCDLPRVANGVSVRGVSTLDFQNGHRAVAADTCLRTTTDPTVPVLCGPPAAKALHNSPSRTSVPNDLDDNANEATDFFCENSPEEFPHACLSSVDFSSSSYMDLSVSSDSDLEFFDSDYTSGPLHNSFKGQSHPDNFRHLQILSAPSFQQYESPACLLEALIGLSDPITEDQHLCAYNLPLEVLQ